MYCALKRYYLVQFMQTVTWSEKLHHPRRDLRNRESAEVWPRGFMVTRPVATSSRSSCGHDDIGTARPIAPAKTANHLDTGQAAGRLKASFQFMKDRAFNGALQSRNHIHK
jgi:hypothetical protein